MAIWTGEKEMIIPIKIVNYTYIFMIFIEIYLKKLLMQSNNDIENKWVNK